ncbi:O-antigen ligase family protein [Roseovarius sp. D22-M7]|uniref:O-antigen ligase family protein n=1 Tax=Roseovarius sp. D22-M7 TaxID=3127116 RepID=UPI00300FE5E6
MAHVTVDHTIGPTLRISPQVRDFLVFTIWSMVTFVQFRGDELLLYPLALYYAYSIWRDQNRIVPLLARAWVVLLFPTWCLISVLWAVDPVDAFKHALYLFLTLIICFQVAATLSARQIMHAVCIAASVIALVHLFVAYGLGRGDLGIFPSKNTMGKTMVILWVVTFAVFLDPGTRWLFRLSSLGMASIAAWLAGASNSATAVLLVLASALLLIAGAVILRGGLLRASRLAILFFSLGLVLSAALAILPYQQVEPVDAVLSHFNKDSTLTGRTVLWQYAENEIREHPLLGVGAGGFWRYQESPLVQKIYFEFYKGPWDNFNFHNSYYEIAVHQGLIGLGIMMLALSWGVFMIGRWAITDGSMPAIYIFSYMMLVLARTMTEADFLKPFVLFHMIFWIGAIKALQRRITPE